MHISKSKAVAFSGLVWFILGFYLLIKGIRLVLEGALLAKVNLPLISSLKPFFPEPIQGALFIVCIGLLIGFIKGRFVLSKTVNRVMSRIHSFDDTVNMWKMYDSRYLILLLSMFLIGMLMKVIPVPQDILALIDISVGSALINGFLIYFRHFLRLVF
ncbi:MAG: hypothetical protein ACOVOR_00245 [Rhabdochlamydiaceae bacterium]